MTTVHASTYSTQRAVRVFSARCGKSLSHPHGRARTLGMMRSEAQRSTEKFDSETQPSPQASTFNNAFATDKTLLA